MTKVHHEVQACAPARATASCTSATRATRRRSARWRWRRGDQPGRDGRRGRGPARLRGAGRPARPDDAVAPRLGGRRRRRARALPRRVDAGPQRPLLRHDEPPVGADGDGRRALRRDRRHRLGQLVEHARSRSWPARPAARALHRVNTADELPDDLSGTVGVTAGASAPNELVEEVIARLDPRDGVEVVGVTDEDEYFPPPPQHPRPAGGDRGGGDGDARRRAADAPVDGRPQPRRQRRVGGTLTACGNKSPCSPPR